MVTLIGRDRELDLLRDAFERLVRGEGSLILLVGEAGIGKTRLADELIATARARGATIGWGGSWDGGGAPSWWPWIQIIRAVAPSLPAPDERLRRELGPLWSEHEVTSEPDDPELTQFRRYDALRAVLHAVAKRGPLVVVLEDLHAADLASLEALQFIARSQRSLPVLVIATQREAEPGLPAQAAAVLVRIAREAKLVRLAPLDRAAVVTMLADLDPVPGDVIDRILTATGGNPLYIAEAIRALRSGARDFLGGVRVLIGERLAKFTPATRDALDRAAILGRDVTAALVAELCGVSDVAVREQLRPAIAAGILTDSDGVLQFTHALFRERLLEELSPERSREIHHAAGQMLARHHARGRARADTVAMHLLAALPDGDAHSAVRWAARAAEETIRELAFDRAVTLLEQAIAALDRAEGSVGERVDLELRLAEVLARTGAGDRSRAVSLAAADVARTLRDGARMVRAALAYGAELRVAVVDPVLIGLLEEALAMLDDDDLARRARVMARLAAARQPAIDPRPPVAEARRALELARESGDDDALVYALDWAWSAMTNSVPVTERASIARQLVTRAMARGDLVIAQRAYARLALDAAELCELSELDLAISDHARLGAALGHARWQWLTPIMRSMRALMLGRWDEAARAQMEAADLIAQIDHPYAARVLAVHRIGSFKVRWAGELADLLALVQQGSATLARGDGDDAIRRLIRAGIAARFGSLDMARRLIDGITVARVAPYPAAILGLSEVVAAVGDRERATELLPLAQTIDAPAGTWGAAAYIWEGPVAMIVGVLAATLERWDLAIDSFEEALALAVSLEAWPLLARGKHVLAEALLRRGKASDRARAAQLLDEALAEASALDQPHLRRIIEHSRKALDLTSVANTSDASWTMERDGDVWTISCAEGIVRLKHSRALELLDRLRREPGREHHVLDLLGQGDAVDVGDAGEMLDAEAQRAYRHRIAELQRDLAEAEQWNDHGRCEQMRVELDLLTDELARAVGLGGRARRAGSAVERARVNVHKRLRGIIQRIGETLPHLASHLAATVKTGTHVGYRIESHP